MNTIKFDIESFKLNPNETALLSTDNSRSFQKESLQELYVPGGEEAAIGTKRLIDLTRNTGVLCVNILEEHPNGHISFASSYINKKPFDKINLIEIKDWTDQDNGLSPKAAFTLDELRAYLIERGGESILWPDHCVAGKEGCILTEPLTENDFDIKIIKANSPETDAYNGFKGTNLNDTLRKKMIRNTIITGVVSEICVAETAVGSFINGFNTFICSNAIRGLSKDSEEKKLIELGTRGIIVVTQNQLIRALS